MNIRPEVEAIKNILIQWRRDFHQYPELGFEEHRTSSIIAKTLISFGMSPKTGVGKTGVTADLNFGEGPTIALRADMDALPMQEPSGLSFSSQHDGVMHACGHDGHMAMLLGAAKILSQMDKELTGTIRFIFQPAEEGEGGARYMIEDGCLEGVDEIYGIHVWNYQPVGEVGAKEGGRFVRYHYQGGWWTWCNTPGDCGRRDCSCSFDSSFADHCQPEYQSAGEYCHHYRGDQRRS